DGAHNRHPPQLSPLRQEVPTLREAPQQSVRSLLASLRGQGGRHHHCWPVPTFVEDRWFMDILARCQFFQAWIDFGKTPPVHWISGIFFPQDDIHDPKTELTVAPADGVYIYGLFLEGRCSMGLRRAQAERLQANGALHGYAHVLVPAGEKSHAEPARLSVSDLQGALPKGGAVLLTTGHSLNFARSNWIKAGVAAFLALRVIGKDSLPDGICAELSGSAATAASAGQTWTSATTASADPSWASASTGSFDGPGATCRGDEDFPSSPSPWDFKDDVGVPSSPSPWDPAEDLQGSGVHNLIS
ncbi:unnamed protein product, partial [Polarella glacialis]